MLLWFSLLPSTGSRVSVHGPSYRKPPLALLIAVIITYHLPGNNVFRFLSPAVDYTIGEGPALSIGVWLILDTCYI